MTRTNEIQNRLEGASKATGGERWYINRDERRGMEWNVNISFLPNHDICFLTHDDERDHENRCPFTEALAAFLVNAPADEEYLLQENKRLKEENERMKNLQISELVYKNGQIDIIGSHPIFHILMAEAARMFTLKGATNYLTMTGRDKDGNTYDITIQKVGGKTPIMRLLELEADSEKRFTQGMCVAVAYIIKEGYDTMAADILKSAGISIAEVKEAEVDSFDADTIIPFLKELESGD